MQQFFNTIAEAGTLAEANNIAAALTRLNDAFKTLLYEESDAPIILDAKMIKAVDNARKITEQVADLPEIEQNGYVADTLDATQDAIENYLQDKIDADTFWEEVIDLGRLIYYLDGVANYLGKKGAALGTQQNPALTVSLSEDGSMQLYARIAEDGLSLEEASEMQQAFVQAMSDENIGSAQLINLAGKLLTGQQFEEAIKVYENIVFRFPDETAQCLNAIGACHYYLENYETAIRYYMNALNAGELKERVEYNVWESCQSIIDIAADRKEQMKWKFFFADNFPESKYELSF